MAALPSSERRVPPLGRALLLRRRSYGLIRQSRLALLYFSLSFDRGVFAGWLPPDPCCHRDLPDVISANLSSDAWSHAAAVPGSAHACSFLPVLGLAQQGCGSASRFNPRTRLFTERLSGLQTFLYVQASEFAHLPGRSYRCAYRRRAAEVFTSGPTVLRYLRTHRIC